MPFTLSGPWEVSWSTTADTLQIHLNSAEGTWITLLANQWQPGSGESYHPLGGTYYLLINATGPWKLDVREVR